MLLVRRDGGSTLEAFGAFALTRLGISADGPAAESA